MTEKQIILENRFDKDNPICDFCDKEIFLGCSDLRITCNKLVHSECMKNSFEKHGDLIASNNERTKFIMLHHNLKIGQEICVKITTAGVEFVDFT